MLHSLGLPHPRYALRVIGRTLLMWLLVKLVFVALLGVSAALLPSLGAPALFVYVDRRFAHERLLQANLGASEWWLAGSTLAVCFILDAAVRAVATAFLVA